VHANRDDHPVPGVDELVRDRAEILDVVDRIAVNMAFAQAARRTPGAP
jgi:hypothetical protein